MPLSNTPFFIAVDKPAGYSSAAVLNKLKYVLGIKKAGYCGTLDPMATGVLVIALNSATKLISLVTDARKQYTGTMTFGVISDSYDTETESKVVSASPQVTQAMLDTVIPQFSGDITQRPPIYSAIKVAGKRAYKRARKGETFSIPERTVHIFNLQLTTHSANSASFIVDCSKGTYIRSLIHDIGQTLGCGAVMSSLTRTKVGTFSLTNALPWDTLLSENRKAIEQHLVSIDTVLHPYPHRVADVECFSLLRNGREISKIFPDLPEGLSWVSFNNKPAFLLENNNGTMRYRAYVYGEKS